jgi:lipopolysaccharide/colanic/teichoic acid biosynthesis glycosyltransferase
MKRLADIVGSMLALLILCPVLLIISLVVATSSPGGVFFSQIRVGKGGKNFKLLKFRTMAPDAEQSGQLTVGHRDPRITKVGVFLRKSKLDELPQILNILAGSMSFVGPRPEVPKYVGMYTSEQRRVLAVRPGLTDVASLEYYQESELLALADDPEQTYIREIMPQKLRLSLAYLEERRFGSDLVVFLRTLVRLFR